MPAFQPVQGRGEGLRMVKRTSLNMSREVPTWYDGGEQTQGQEGGPCIVEDDDANEIKSKLHINCIRIAVRGHCVTICEIPSPGNF